MLLRSRRGKRREVRHPSRRLGVPATGDLWEITNGTWEASWETDAGYQVHIDVVGPKKCHITLANAVEEDGKHTLTSSRIATEWTLVRA
ncbi:hypothetical protein [Kitasatospora sp. NPDC001527]|uniref:hypothetical protein n=1 Tax=Kitasatospora sp. NPDC001527 TaxID=3154519 RepID=UPI0033324F1E